MAMPGIPIGTDNRQITAQELISLEGLANKLAATGQITECTLLKKVVGKLRSEMDTKQCSSEARVNTIAAALRSISARKARGKVLASLKNTRAKITSGR